MLPPVRRARMCADELPPGDRPHGDADGGGEHPLDMEVLRRRMADVDRKRRAGWAPSDSVIDMSGGDGHSVSDEDEMALVEAFERLEGLWIIVFTSAADGTEGVYSLALGDENIVLAFQEKEEAQRYAICLEVQEFPMPQICMMASEELRDFCAEAGFRLGFVPTGSLISPPEESAIDDLDMWRGKPNGRADGDSVGLSEEDIESMKKRLDSLFGE